MTIIDKNFVGQRKLASRLPWKLPMRDHFVEWKQVQTLVWCIMTHRYENHLSYNSVSQYIITLLKNFVTYDDNNILTELWDVIAHDSASSSGGIAVITCYINSDYLLIYAIISLNLTLYRLFFPERIKSYIHMLYHFSALIWRRYLNPFSSKTKDPPILHNPYCGCWCSGDERGQGVSNHDIDLVKPW